LGWSSIERTGKEGGSHDNHHDCDSSHRVVEFAAAPAPNLVSMPEKTSMMTAQVILVVHLNLWWLI